MKLRTSWIWVISFCALISGSAGATPLLSSIELEMFNLINTRRSEAGVAPLTLDPHLREAALGHVTYLAQTGSSLSHIGSGGSTYIQRIRATGYAGTPFLPAELMGANQEAQGMVTAWIAAPLLPNSPFTHGQVLMAASASDIGIGWSSQNSFWDVLLNPVVLTLPSTADPETPAVPLSINLAVCAGITDPEALALCLINDVRMRSGVGILSLDNDLMEASAAFNQDRQTMGNKNTHIGSDGSDFSDRVAAAGYEGQVVAELIGPIGVSADWLVQAWLDYPAYRDRLLDSRINEMGIDFQNTWTAEFGIGSTASPIPTPGTLSLLSLSLALLGLINRRSS